MKAGALKFGAWDAMQQLGSAAVARAAWSRRQLLEVMVDVWSNQLNVDLPLRRGVGQPTTTYDAGLIRKHALGRFADLLKATATARRCCPTWTTAAPPRRSPTRTTPASLVPVLPATYGALVDALARRLIGAPLPAAHVAAVLSVAGKVPTSPLTAGDTASPGTCRT